MNATEKQLIDIDPVLERIFGAQRSMASDKRLIVGIVGAPASGKSTLANRLETSINKQAGQDNRAVVVPMDGYHLDNTLLDKRGLRAVKGAPQTFDATGLLELVKRLRADLTTEVQEAEPIYIPVFDRQNDLARCAASAVLPQHRIVLLEGNYLLLKRPVWCEFAAYFDLTVFLQVPLPILEQRLIKRWLNNGYDEPAARKRALSNDIPNAHVVSKESSEANLTVSLSD